MKKGPDNTNDPHNVARQNEELILQLQTQVFNLERKIQQKESEIKRFKTISKFVPGAFFQFRIDIEGTFFIDYLSKGAENVLGRPLSDLADPTKILGYLHPDDLEGFLSSIDKSKVEMSMWEHQYRVRSENDNSYFWIHGKSLPREKKDGTVIWNGLLLDITKQKKLEQKIIEKKEQFENMVNRIIDGYASHRIILDNTGRAIDYETISVNKSYENLLNINSQDVVGKKASEILPANELKKWLKIFEPVALKGKLKKYTIYSEQNNKYFEGTAFSQKNGFFEVFFVDVSEYKKYEIEIQKKNSFLNAIIDNSPIPKFITDKEGTLISTNNSLLKHLNINKKEVVGIYNLLKDENLAEQGFLPKVRSVFQNKKSVRFIMQWFGNRSGFESLAGSNNPWIDVTMFPLHDENGNLTNIVCQWIDITEQKETNFALQKSEERFRIISDNSPDAIFVTDKEGNYVYVNQEATNLLGYSKKELLQVNVIDVVERFKTDRNILPYANLLSGEKHFFESNLIRKNGTILPVDINSVLLENGNVYASCRDISIRKKFEKELILAKERAEESEKIFHDLFNNLNSGVAIYEVIESGKDFIFKYFNDSAERIDKQNRNDIIGKSIFDLRPNVEEFGLIETFRKVLKTKQPLHYPVKMYNDDVLEGYYENYVFLLPSGELVAVFDDVTERVKFESDLSLAKEKAEESDFRLKLATDSGKLGVWDWNVKENFMVWNHRMFELYGISEKEFTGVDSWVNALHPDDYEKANNEVELALNGSKEFNTTFRIIQPDNTIRHIKADAIVLRDTNSNPISMIGINRDITELITFQSELIKAKEKAEESDRLKSAFLANMSHEIRTPMNGILGFTSLLKEPGLKGDDQKKYLEIIQKSGERLLNTVNDIVEISKIETGIVKITPRIVNIGKHILTLCDFFSLEAQKKGLELLVENNLTEDELFIKTDKNKISSVISNILKNAIKFTEKGSIKIGCRRNEDWLEVCIRDTGIGIPDDRREAIFNRFEQADLKDSRVFEGSGLGLSIAKSYVEMLGGKIWVESEENKGSVFYFTVPYNNALLKENKSVKTRLKHPNMSETKKLKILVAEDDNVSQIHLNIVLKDLAKEILFVETGTEAIETLKNHPDIDIVLMDIKMPEMNGYEATREIRGFNKDVIIIAQTAFALEGDKQKVLDAGCNDYISKPIFKKSLISLIEKYDKTKG